MSLSILAPASGVVVGIAEVPDPVFSGRLLGPGLAIVPERAPGCCSPVLAPVGGTVSSLHPHAFVITAPGGREVLVHLGLETVGLEGRHFEVLAHRGQEVEAGRPVVSWSPAAVEAAGLNPIVPLVALGGRERDLSLPGPGTRVRAGQALLRWG
ncbi:PTS sugar transporter subunit IIA [Actinomyces bowdenii]|uniref:PTS glucose transporter subunit IIA n=1 Tax=Actinomyces bowdenii TaxID=131109 RepID=A0A853EII6_9ACTO|nr:PTS glucose transporter subunit IIA [Actinomyces bowdenii]MBF0696382.1 PTS glucose transporter subunit IIA [Actinomyces bowdenii]NYS68555.1 PTS glucose transporter subunit IIA [Actinomyces bowdenii]